MDQVPAKNSLVLYKQHPARVLSVTDKLEIELDKGKIQRVRPKDVLLLHGGPLSSLAELTPQAGELQEAWQLLAGSETSLEELSELAFGQYTPATAWATWQQVMNGLLFQGTPETLIARAAEEVAKEREAREAKETERQARRAFLERMRSGTYLAHDVAQLSELEILAYGQRNASRILQDLGLPQTPEQAYALLLKLGYWDETVNPYPMRAGLSLEPPRCEPRALPEEDRVDLTHLPAFAIDDEGNTEPDDALSLDGDRLWVHIADVAAVVRPDDTLDLEARARGATLYLPEASCPMLPPGIIQMLGLGLQEISPALSFGLHLDMQGNVIGMEAVASWIRVTRLTYEEAEARLSEVPFRPLRELTERFKRRRGRDGAICIQLPEVKLTVENGDVRILPLPPLESRSLVRESMLMAGEAVANFATHQGMPFPFATQVPPENWEMPDDLAGMFAYRKQLKRSQMKSTVQPHAGLGLQAYAQITSPLRRYLDLVAHQQLRGQLKGRTVFTAEEIVARVGATEAATGQARRTERLSNAHWTLVYLNRRPQWCGRGVVVEKQERRATVLIPELGLETKVYVNPATPLNSEIALALDKVDLPSLTAHFRVVDRKVVGGTSPTG